MPVLKFNQCDYDCHDKKNKRGSFRVYCRKVDKTCSQGSPTPKDYVRKPHQRQRLMVSKEYGADILLPMPPLPPGDTRPKRFYQEQDYIGINFRKEEHGEWIDSLNITKFQGRPHNVYNFKIIVEYNNDLWNHLIQRIKSEATVYNRESVIKDDYAYTVAKIISTPKRPIVTQTVPLSERSTEQSILSILTNTPTHINDIVVASKLPVGEVSSTLLFLELEGLIKRLPGAYFVKKENRGQR